jgi:hypothetical protein
MSKTGSHCSFGHLKHKLWPKERPKIKLTIWFVITKSWESTQFTCLQRACDILLKCYWWTLQLCLRSHLNQKSARKVMGVPTCSISRLPLRSPETKKNHLDVGLVVSHKVYYKGEGGGFPQVQALVSFVCSCCSWLVLTPKVFQLYTNHIVLVLCKPVWTSEAC